MFTMVRTATFDGFPKNRVSDLFSLILEIGNNVINIESLDSFTEYNQTYTVTVTLGDIAYASEYNKVLSVIIKYIHEEMKQ